MDWDSLMKIPQKSLDIENRDRTNKLEWRGQFSPQLVEEHLSRVPISNYVVLDPFCGSGTVLIEAARLHVDAIGIELNSAAYRLAKLYQIIPELKDKMNHNLSLIDTIIEEMKTADNEWKWDQGLKSLDGIVKQYDGDKKTILEALILISSKKRGSFVQRLEKGFFALKNIIKDMPETKSKIQCFQRDARTTGLDDEIVDFVFTSPPYINVFNYHQNYRREIEAFGYDTILTDAKSEIGSNRKNRGNRILTVIQYCIDMKLCLDEIHRVMKSGGMMVMVVGRESNVRGISFSNSEIVEDLATNCCSFDIKGIRERKFVNKFGITIFEDLIYMAKTDVKTSKISPDDIARKHLNASISNCPEESLSDLESAIEAIGSVVCSPPFIRTNVAQASS